MPERPFPRCDEYTCFAYRKGTCSILTSRPHDCGFFKTKDQIDKTVVKAYRRLSAKGHNVHKEFPILWGQYQKANKLKEEEE